MCFVWISEQTAIISLYSINLSVFINEAETVYCAVRTGYLNQTDFVLKGLKEITNNWRRVDVRRPPTAQKLLPPGYKAQLVREIIATRAMALSTPCG